MYLITSVLVHLFLRYICNNFQQKQTNKKKTQITQKCKKNNGRNRRLIELHVRYQYSNLRFGIREINQDNNIGSERANQENPKQYSINHLGDCLPFYNGSFTIT